jgi:integrase
MQKRYQRGSVTRSSDGRYWIGKYRDKGRHKTKLLGKIGEISRSRAQQKFDELLHSVRTCEATPDVTLKDFVEHVYFPFYQRKWKESTLMTNRERINKKIVADFGSRELRNLKRDELQNFLDSKASLSFSTADHLRWDLRQIFEMAIAEGLLTRNPAAMLFTPRQCPMPERPTMSADQVTQAFAVLDLRERLVFKLAVLAGLRPGEIFALRRSRLTENSAHVQERIYRGRLDTPKTRKSVRMVALSASLQQDLREWLAVCPVSSEGWLFPSEILSTPMSKDNMLYRYIRPRLLKVGLGWVDYQVLRRTYATLMRKAGVDPKVVADSMGHDLDVNLNTYTQTPLDSRLEAVQTLESSFVN